MRKLVKAWNNLPAGTAVTTEPMEQVVLVDKDRLAHLEREGHLGESARQIPAEVRTSVPIEPPGMDKGGHNEAPVTTRPASAPKGQGGKAPLIEEP